MGKNTFNQTSIIKISRVHLEQSMVERGWCSLITRPLSVPEHDGREKVVRAMLLFTKSCRAEFAKVRAVLKELLLEYRILAGKENPDNQDSSDSYFTNLKTLIEKLLLEMGDIKEEL